MDVSGIGSNSLMQSVWADLSALALEATEDSDSTTSSALLSAATLELSGPAKLFAGLEQAYQQDPEKFAATLNSIADKLESAVEETGDSKEKQMLSDMAARFREVAESGDISQLRPPGAKGGPGGPQGAYTSSSEQSQKNLLDYLTESDDEDDSVTLDLESLLDRLDSLLAEYLNKNSSTSTE